MAFFAVEVNSSANITKQCRHNTKPVAFARTAKRKSNQHASPKFPKMNRGDKNTKFTLPGTLPWRVLCSNVVNRQNTKEDSQTPKEGNNELQVAPLQNENFRSKLAEFNWAHHHLRSPTKKYKKKRTADASTLTKHCESLFSHIMTKNTPARRETDFTDPSYSVRNIVKGSGLLKTFGTGFLEKEEKENIAKYRYGEEQKFRETRKDFFTVPTSPSPIFPPTQLQQNKSPLLKRTQYFGYQRPFSPMPFATFSEDSNDPGSDLLRPNETIGFNSNSLPIHFQFTPPQNNGLFEPNQSATVSSPLNNPELNTEQSLEESSNSPQNFLYDTIVLQKTVETQVIEYDASMTPPSPSASYFQPPRRSKPTRNKRQPSSKRAKLKRDSSGYEPSSESES